jgi:hypothetical protein
MNLESYRDAPKMVLIFAEAAVEVLTRWRLGGPMLRSTLHGEFVDMLEFMKSLHLRVTFSEMVRVSNRVCIYKHLWGQEPIMGSINCTC